MSGTDLYLRQADMSDAMVILEWRNDKTAREQSFSGGIIDPDSHLKWYKDKLSDPDSYLYMLMSGGECVGHIRLDIEDREAKISYMISPKHRKKGYGTKIIELCEDKILNRTDRLVAFVKSDNMASAQCFRKNGYTEEIDGETIRFSKEIGNVDGNS